MKKKLNGKALTKARNEASQFVGVSVDICNPNKPFKAMWYESSLKKNQHLGYFPIALSAAVAYNKKAKDTFGTAKIAKKHNKWNTIAKV